MINLYFSDNREGGPVFVSCEHKESKRIFSYLIKIIKELNISRPNMLPKKVEGKWQLKILSISKDDILKLKQEIQKKKYKFNGTELVFNFGENVVNQYNSIRDLRLAMEKEILGKE